MGFRVHIVGCAPRSGTTLLKELFTAGFETTSLAPHEVSILVRPRHLEGVCVSKHPKETRTARFLLPFDPSLWVIYCLRDPRDVICSRHPNDPSRYVVEFNTWLESDRVARRMRHPRFLTVRYEDLVTHPDRVQNYISNALPFLVQKQPFSEALGAIEISEDSRRAMHNATRIHRNSMGRWRRHLPRIGHQLRRFPELKGELIARGYEDNDLWTRAMPDVSSDSLRGKHANEGSRRWFSRRRRRRLWLGVKYMSKLCLDSIGNSAHGPGGRA